jgi:hypothetical protein
MVDGGNGLAGRLQVSVEADTIIIRVAGTGHCVTYRRTSENPWLIASDIREDPNSPIDRFTFRARAWTAANDKARELGWIV